MTMDNGEGRPLDELESGQQDPQDWYFDLPSDAWKRQEEKNRQLRERVRSGEQEPPERARRDPWVLNRPAPEPPKKRGLFGLGRKKKDGEEEPRRAAPRQGAFGGWMEEPRGGEDDDEWSTERLEPGIASQPLQLKPRGGAAPGGPGDAPQEPAGTVEPPPLRLRPRREQEEGSRLNWDFGPGAWPGPEAERPAGEQAADAEDDGGSIVAQMRAWAERGRDEGHRRFGAGFEAARDDGGQPAPRQWDAAGFPPEPADAAPTAGMAAEDRAEFGGEAPEPSAGWHEERSAAETAAPPGLPLIRRRQPEEIEPGREPGKSSKWDEFFGLNRDGSEETSGAGFSEGLAAMREWAKKKPIGEDVRDLSQVPEEFLKPFDWELEEQQRAEAAAAPAGSRMDGVNGPADGPAEAADESEPGAAEFAASWSDASDEDVSPFAASEAEAAAPGYDAAFDSAASRPMTPDAEQADRLAAFAPQESDAGAPGGVSDTAAEWRELTEGNQAAPLAAFAAHEPGTDPAREQFDIPAAWQETSDGRGGPFAGRGGDAAGDDDPLAGLFPARELPGAAGHAAEPAKEKRGLFGRLFGRKRQEEPADAAGPGTDRQTAWRFEQDSADDAGPGASFEPAGTPGVFEGSRLVADAAPASTPQGWGANAGEALADDVEAVSDFAAQVQSLAWQLDEGGRQPAAEAGEDPAEEPAGAADGEGWAPEIPAAVALAHPDGAGRLDAADAGDEDEWAPEPVELGAGVFEPVEFPRADAEPARGEAAADGHDQGWAPEPVELSPSAFGAAVQAALWGDGGTASPAVEPAAEEPRPWWEASEAEETVEEAVASIAERVSPAEPASEEPRPWWEAREAEETVEEAVASIAEPESLAVEPAAEEPRPWWEAREAEETVEEAGRERRRAGEPGGPRERGAAAVVGSQRGRGSGRSGRGERC
ncbi:MAG: hypothetical protein KatS3mg064_1633 [Tepidiforma sp.]|nr:hypothetical protein [Tepidiforma sp.]GIW18476.1 MAG: hypothetical protein KatS3mg064_1633 [Tepidiforma sp.]